MVQKLGTTAFYVTNECVERFTDKKETEVAFHDTQGCLEAIKSLR